MFPNVLILDNLSVMRILLTLLVCFLFGVSSQVKAGDKVACGGDYYSYEHSRDGSSVCAGGDYYSYEHSRDGTDVACGGDYYSYEHSRDGSSVCAGGGLLFLRAQ